MNEAKLLKKFKSEFTGAQRSGQLFDLFRFMYMTVKPNGELAGSTAQTIEELEHILEVAAERAAGRRVTIDQIYRMGYSIWHVAVAKLEKVKP